MHNHSIYLKTIANIEDKGFVSIRRFSAASRFKNQYGIFFLMETVSY